MSHDNTDPESKMGIRVESSLFSYFRNLFSFHHPVYLHNVYPIYSLVCLLLTGRTRIEKKNNNRKMFIPSTDSFNSDKHVERRIGLSIFRHKSVSCRVAESECIIKTVKEKNVLIFPVIIFVCHCCG